MKLGKIFMSPRKRRERRLRKIVVDSIRNGHVRVTPDDLKRAYENRMIQVHNSKIK